MEHVVVWKERDRYCSFPHVVWMPSGQLGLVFRRASKFSADAARNGTATHHDPDSAIEYVESADEGRTWSKECRTLYKSSYGVNDPSLTVLRDRSVLLRFVALEIVRSPEFRAAGKVFSHRAEHGLVAQIVGNLVLRSRDSGATWSKVGFVDVSEIGPSCSRDPIVELVDGAWLAPVYTGAPQRSDISWVVRSFDLGRSWRAPTRIMCDARGRYSQLQGVNYNETSLLDLGNGALLALVRADNAFHTDDGFMPVGGCGELMSAASFDGGLSWTAPRQTGLWGQPGSLLRLRDGRVLATYGHRRRPYGVRCCISLDQGATWDTEREIMIRDDAPTWDCGYPFSVQLNEDELLTVYYIADDEGTRFVAGTRWTLP